MVTMFLFSTAADTLEEAGAVAEGTETAPPTGVVVAAEGTVAAEVAAEDGTEAATAPPTVVAAAEVATEGEETGALGTEVVPQWVKGNF